MLKRLSLLTTVVMLSVSCKKDKQQAADELLVGSWQSMIQLQTGDHWPLINADSVRAAGHFSYELKSNHTGTFKRVIFPANQPIPPDYISNWKPGMPLGSVHTTPLPGVPVSLIIETVAGYWEYNKEKKKLTIIGSQRQTLESWHLEVVQDRQLITPTLLLHLISGIPGMEVKQKVRIIFIKK